MTAIEFHPEKRTIEELFVGADYFVIPRFQRPYSWEPANLDDFWRDVVYDNGVGYFIGPMVAWRDPDSPIRRVVDGQQRLTTISLMFAVLRDKFSKLGETDLAEALDRYLQKTDRNNERSFTLTTEVEARYLSQAIFKNPPDKTVRPQSEEEHAIHKALTQITKLIDTEISNYSAPVDRLREIRDRLLGLLVIWVEHSNEDDAYIIFETLNSRGKDLDVADLLKNHLLNKLRGTGNPAADTARSKWNDMRSIIEADGTTKSRLDVNRFILHWWLSREDYIAERKLFRAIKRTVSTKSLAKSCLDDLVTDAEFYRKVMDPHAYTWPIEDVDASRALIALTDFGIVQPAPLLLSLVRARASSPRLNAGQFRTTLQTIERFHVQYTVVSQLSSSGGVSEMYAKAAKDLTKAGVDQNERAEILKGIRRKLIDRAPDRDTFVNAFVNRFYFTNDYTRDSKAVRYILGSILRARSPNTTQDNLTIEHLMPQSALRSGKTLEVVGSIGNLLLVSSEVNDQLGNGSFEHKERILASSAKAYDIGGVIGLKKWSAADIQARAKLLAEFAYDTVWKLPV